MLDIFEALKRRLIQKFPPPVPLDVSVWHHGCGKLLRGMPRIDDGLYIKNAPNKYVVCEGTEFEYGLNSTPSIGGCRGVWTDADLSFIQDEDLGKYFWARDEGYYKLELNESSQNKTAFHTLVAAPDPAGFKRILLAKTKIDWSNVKITITP